MECKSVTSKCINKHCSLYNICIFDPYYKTVSLQIKSRSNGREDIVFTDDFLYKKYYFRSIPGQCFYCKQYVAANKATVDHILPKCFGGTKASYNVVDACVYCNLVKGNLSLSAFRERVLSNKEGRRHKESLAYVRKHRETIIKTIDFMLLKLAPNKRKNINMEANEEFLKQSKKSVEKNIPTNTEENKKEELPLTPTEEVIEEPQSSVVLFKNIQEALVKNNITEETIKAMRESFLPLTINGIHDKEGYKLVNEKRILCKNTAVLAKKICEQGRKDAVAEQKAWIKVQNDVTSQIRAIEEELEAKQKVIDDEKRRIKEEEEKKEQARLQSRTVLLINLGMTLQGENYVLEDHLVSALHVKIYDDFNFEALVAPVRETANRIKLEKEEAEKKRLEDEEKFRQLQAQQEEERRKLEEERTAFEAAQKKAKEEEEERIKAIQEETKKLLEAKKKTRIEQLFNLGMAYTGDKYVFQGFSIKEGDITSVTDDSWAKFLEETAKPTIAGIKQEIEKERLAKIEEDKKAAVEAERKRMEAEILQKELEAERLRKEQEAKQLAEKLEAERLASLKPDEEKLTDYLKKLWEVPRPTFSNTSYIEFSTTIENSLRTLLKNLSNQKPK